MRHGICKKAALLALLMILISLTGCAEMVGLDAQSLMAPPKTTADQQAIYALMTEARSDIKMIYPKNGEYRSAVISRDLDDDGNTEVVSFYTDSDSSGICIHFFSKGADGTWSSLSRFTSAANQVDKVFFGDLTGDGQEEIVVGWGDPLTATASIAVYHKDGSTVQEVQMSAETYSEMLLTDFDEDGKQELFVLETAKSSEADGAVSAPLGRVFRFDGAQSYVAQTIPLDAAITRYTSVSFANISATRRAVVIDGVKADGRMTTQIVGYDASIQALTAPLSGTGEEQKTERAAAVSVTARDINGDGIIEIPIARLRIEQGDMPLDSTDYSVEWNTYSLADNRFTPVLGSIVNAAENYLVLLSADEENIACENDTVTRTAVFFRYRTKVGSTIIGREEIAAITVYSQEAWKEHEDDGAVFLGNEAGRVYVLEVLGEGLSVDSGLIRNITDGFKILNE